MTQFNPETMHEVRELHMHADDAIAAALQEAFAILAEPEQMTYRLTCDIWGYEPGIGIRPTIWEEGDAATEFEAASDEEALKIAEGMIRKYRWTEWERDDTGYERSRTAKNYSNSWMRVERLDD